jgi:hypothetical protein
VKILAPFEATNLNETKVGDLIRIIHSPSPFGLIVHSYQGQRVVAVLQDAETRPPYHIAYKRDFPCFRYTAGWVLELPQDGAEFSADKLASTAGVIHIGKNGPLLNLSASTAEDEPLTVNLNTFDWDDVDHRDAAFPIWRIWASADDMQRDDATPIFEFKAPQSTT